MSKEKLEEFLQRARENLAKPPRPKKYPNSFDQLETWFSTEKKCRNYLCRIRWPNKTGFSCPKCGGIKAWITDRGMRICRSCRKQISVTSGTLFENSNVKLETWFQAIWAMADQDGVTALRFKEKYDIGSYKTAWTIVRRIRQLMVDVQIAPVKGTVYFHWFDLHGYRRFPLHEIPKESWVACFIQARTVRGPERINLRAIADTDINTLSSWIRDQARAGSTIVTDESLAAQLTTLSGVKCIAQSAQEMRKISSPVCDRLVGSMRKKKLNAGTHKRLQSYLDEHAFRFNWSMSERKHRQGYLFWKLVTAAVRSECVR